MDFVSSKISFCGVNKWPYNRKLSAKFEKNDWCKINMLKECRSADTCFTSLEQLEEIYS